MVMLTGGMVLVLVAILMAVCFWWGRHTGYKTGRSVGFVEGRGVGFKAHEDLVFGRIYNHYKDEADDLIHYLLA